MKSLYDMWNFSLPVTTAIYAAIFTAMIAWILNASPYPPFKGWWFVGIVTFGAMCGYLAAWGIP